MKGATRKDSFVGKFGKRCSRGDLFLAMNWNPDTDQEATTICAKGRKPKQTCKETPKGEGEGYTIIMEGIHPIQNDLECFDAMTSKEALSLVSEIISDIVETVTDRVQKETKHNLKVFMNM